jgi:sec-independent protein translocase protein TatB
MLDISWSELLLIGVVALVVIGPKELPGVLRTVGQWMRKVRSMANDFQNQFQEAMREAEMADLKKQVDDIATDFKTFDPLADVRKDVEAMGKDFESSLEHKPELPASATEQVATVAPAEAPPATSGEAAPALAHEAEAAPAAVPVSEPPLPEPAAQFHDSAPTEPAGTPAKADPAGRSA